MSSSTDQINLETMVSQHPDLLSETMGKEVVMMVLEKSAYYSLDEIGAEIWRLIEIPMTVRQVCDRLLETFEVAPEQCQTDVLKFLNEIHGQGLVQVISVSA